MNYLYITIFVHLFITSLCPAMDCLMEISTIDNPVSVSFLDDYHVVIGGDGCIIFDLTNKKKRIKRIDKEKIKTFHIISNNDHTRFAYSSEKNLAIYSAFTGKRLWKTEPIDAESSIVFSSIDATLFAYRPGRLTSYEYLNKSSHRTAVYSYVECPTPSIACHPTEKKLLYPDTENTLSTIEPDDYYNVKPVCRIKGSVIAGIYSPDGNFITINNHYKGCCIYDLGMKFCYNLLTSIYENTVAISFHPHRPILAILLDNNALQYWNYKTKEVIAMCPHTTDRKNWIKNQRLTQRLSFSPDGRKLIMALAHKCLVIRVPQNNIVMLYTLFKQYSIPIELIRSILQKFILTSGFYRFNLAELSRT